MNSTSSHYLSLKHHIIRSCLTDFARFGNMTKKGYNQKSLNKIYKKMTNEELAKMAQSELVGMTAGELNQELAKGGKFVIFTYAISIIIMTYRRPSNKVYFIRHNESAIKYGWPYLFLSFLFGWWGFPFGPIYTIQSIITAFRGNDVTQEVLASINNSNIG